MTKKYSSSPTLLIVESPAKCKKIEEYLGPGFQCIASFGHIRELNSLANINKETFEAQYQIMTSKKKQVNNIKNAIKTAGEIIIATDNDREGEAIGWHLCQVFNLDTNTTKRIIFHEITEKAIKDALANPVKINLNIVYAQQTRQILDLMVGYEISPLLGKFINQNTKSKKPLSAGRCQTPTLKLIYDRQMEIDENPGKKIYKTTGYFSINNWVLPFELNTEMENERDVNDFLNKTISFKHVLNCSGPKKKYISPPKPFTTSTIQQTCSNEMHISPKETMKICQTLYEEGFITYMRTDSVCYSNIFIQETHSYINKIWADNFINKEFKGMEISQDAHEAIRPTNISLSDLELNNEISSKEKRVYKIIWENSIESLMMSCSYSSIKATIRASNNTVFSNETDLILFPGWKIVKNKFNLENKEYQYFSKIISTLDIPVTYSKIISNQTIIQTKTHFSEAKIIQMLELNGIGRPSTYASLVEKIKEREYVKKKDVKGLKIECKNLELEMDKIKEILEKKEFGNEKEKVIIQPLGIAVHNFLETNFSDIFNYDFTRELENDLDLIAIGNKKKRDECEKYYKKILFLKNLVLNNCQDQNPSLANETILDEQHSLIIGKYGPIIKRKDEKNNISFIAIRKDIDIQQINNYEIKDIIISNEKKNFCSNETNMIDENVKNNWEYKGIKLDIKKGKYGLYAKWGSNTKSLKMLGNRPINNIRLEEVLRILE